MRKSQEPNVLSHYYMHAVFMVCFFCFIPRFQVKAQVTDTFSDTEVGAVTVDGTTGFENVLTIDVPTSAFGANFVTTDINLVVNYDKTDGTCDTPGTGDSFLVEHGFQLESPIGTQITVFGAGAFSGDGDITPGVAQTFNDEAGVAIPGGVPVDGTYIPDNSFAGFNDQNPEGTWIFRATETAGGDPLCIISVDIVVTAQAGEIEVQGNATTIADGSTTPAPGDDTDFGSLDVSGGVTENIFTINNSGAGILTLSGSPIVEVSGTHAADFTVTSQPPSSSVASGASSTFTLNFNPSALGTRTATISIANDDSDENPYNFDVEGTGATLPEMSVSGNGVEISDGDISPSGSDHTDFGVVTVGSLAREFTVTNSGSTILNLDGSPTVLLTGDAEFSVSIQPATTVSSGGGTATFTILFSPVSAGAFTATVSIDNDDSDEDPYNFSISGSSVEAPGDLTSNLAFWVKADAGILDTGNEVDSWTDQSASAISVTATGTGRPTIITSQVNGNPSLDFDGNDFMNAGDILDFDPGVDTWSFFSVFNVGVGNTGNIIARATGNNGVRQWQYYIGGNDFRQRIGGTNNNNSTVTVTGDWAIGSAVHDVASFDSFVDGASYDPGTPGGAANQSTDVLIGARNTGSNQVLTGEIAEIVFFDTNVSASVQRDIESYLAIKYGITLDISATGYTVGGADIFASNATFDNNIIGIGSDDSQGLNQTSSTSIDGTGLLTLSGASSQEDGDFLVIAHNNGTANTLGASYNGGTTNGSSRVWFVGEENEIGTVTLTIDQADLPTNVEALYVKNNDAALGTGGTLYALTDGGATWTVNVDLEDNDHFSFVSVPEMQVTGNAVEIVDGDASPIPGDDTDFGTISVTLGTQPNTFTINNTGAGILTLGSNAVSVSGTHSADFTVTAQPNTTVAAGGNTSFTITFDPSAAGTRTASVSISNDDEDESPYTFDISGIGATVPEINVSGNAVDISDGDVVPSTTDDTDFGNSSTAVDVVFTITNSGDADLNLGGTPVVSISGDTEFTIFAQADAVVSSAGGTTSFTVRFDPAGATGSFTASLSIDNDDSDENPFNFDIAASNLPSPGGIPLNLSLWLKAGDGVVHVANSVSSWADQSGDSNDATATSNPTLQPAALNGNDIIDFTNNAIGGTAGFYTDEYFIVAQPDVAINGSANGFLLGFETANFGGFLLGTQTDGYVANDRIVHAVGSNGDGDEYRSGIETGTFSTADEPVLFSVRNNALASAQDISLNGLELTTADFANGLKNLDDQFYRIGNNLINSNAYDGGIAEVISYSQRLTDSQRRDIESYLAIKYGLTLDISTSGYTVGGVDIFTGNATFDNNIVGIGQGDSQGLDQTTSQSVVTGAIITLSAATGQDDGDFLIAANNNGTSANLTGSYNGGTINGSARIWLVEETNDVGTVTITADKADLPSNVEALYVVNADASLGSGGTLYTLIDGGTTWTVDVDFANNDHFTYVSVPEMQVTGNAIEIADGDTTPDVGDGSDFDAIEVSSGTQVNTFTINNTGAGILTLGASSVSTSGTHAADFSVTLQPATTVGAAGNVTFEITFNPSAVGLRVASVSITSDDADENPYNFDIQGTGTEVPEIAVSGNGTDITSGDIDASITDDTDFGNVFEGTLFKVFTITNSGSAVLNLSGSPVVDISGSSDFTISVQPTGSTVAASGGTETFTVLFTPTSEGVKTATISITNDDTDESPYTFLVQGSRLSSPGDVASGLSLWLKANQGVSSSSDLVSSWADQSANSNDASQATSDERPTLTSNNLNGNPTIVFDGTDDDLAGGSGFSTADYFIVLDPDELITNDNASESPIGYSTGSSNNALALGPITGSLTNEVVTHSINAGTYVSGLQSTTVSLSDPIIINFKNNAGETQQELFIDGEGQTVGTSGTFSNLSDVAYTLGDDTEEANTFGGSIAELISFSSRLTDAERRNVATYLAIKYGITLDISSESYTVEGVSIYDNTSYPNDIAGIGNDESQGLNQTSSTSSNAGGLVTIGNPASLGDEDFLVWGNDGGSTSVTTSNVPGGTTERLTRIWQSELTNTVGTVDVIFDVTSLPIDASTSTFNLIVAGSGSTMPTGLSSATVSGSGTVATVDGKTTVTFLGILLGDDEFFTLGGTFSEIAPGDLGNNLALWLKADDGVTEASGVVSEWSDKSGNGNTAAQENSGDQPTYTDDQLNGYPTISFDGNDFMILGDVLDFTPQTDAFTYLSVFNTTGTGTLLSRAENTTEANRQYQFLVFGTAYSHVIGGTLTQGSATATGNWQVGASVIGTTDVDSYTLGSIDVNGGAIGTATEPGANVVLGARSNGTAESFSGEMAEVIMFDTDLSTADRRDVETYLAIKYGLTLDIASQDYTVGGTSIYTHNNYTNDIAGIGQDDSQGLNQTTSQSSNDATILTLQNASALADGEFLVWGNDAGGLTTTSANVPGGTSDRFTQIWRVDESGDLGTVDVVFDITSLALNTASSTFNLIVASSGSTMPAGLSSASVSGGGVVSNSGGRVLVTFSGIDFGDGEFFTLGGTFTNEAPGDQNLNLSLWLKADAGPIESGGSVTDWLDRSGNGNDAAQANSSEQPTLSAASLNGNATVVFDGADDDIGGASGFHSVDYFVVLDPDQVYTNTSGDDFVIGLNNEDFSGMVLGAHTANLVNEIITHSDAGSGYRSGILSTTTTLSEPMLVNFRSNAGNTNQELYLDGSSSTVSTANVFTPLTNVAYNLGSNGNDSDDSYTGQIAEIISYTSRLSNANRRDVSTYLAIKYGLTLSIASENYTVGGTSIYNHTAYPANIAGIGRDDSQGLNQTTSVSSLSGASITMSGASSLEDGDFLIWGNDAASLALTTANVPGGVTNMLGRIWRADETNDVGTVDVAFNLSALGLGESGTFNLIVATSGSTMPTGLSSATVSAAGTISTIDGIAFVTFSGATINDGEFFTLGGDLSQPSPGGIDTNLTLWLKASAGVGLSGDDVTTWTDQSGNGNTATQTVSSARPTYVADGLNGNPAISFDGSNTMVGSAGFNTQEYFVVLDPNEIYNNINQVGRIIGFEPGDFSSLSLGPTTFLQDNEIITHALDGDGYRSMQVSTSSNFGSPSVLASHNNAGGTGQEIDRNGALISDTELNAGDFTNFVDNGYQLGEAFNIAVSAPLNGSILEVISYSSTLSATDRRDVTTYLALKYGIPLDVTTLDYTVGGASIYNHTTYPTDIAGIGMNTDHCLEQSSSQSTNDGSITKVQNASDLQDGEYLVWGNDGGSNDFTMSDVPSGVVQRLNKIWRVDETGDVGSVDISFDLTSLGIDVSNTTINLIISSTTATMPTDLATGTLVTGGTLSTVNGRDIITFSAVDFSDGDFFTIGGDVQTTAPGGVSENLSLWLRGDDGITSSSSVVSNWSDKSGTGNDAFQGNASSQPTLTESQLNYHDVISFNDDYLEGVSGFNTHDYFVVLSPSSEVSSGASFGYAVGFSQRDNNGIVLGAETALLTDETISHITSDISGNTYASGQTSTSIVYNTPSIVNSSNNAGGTGQELYSDGSLLTVTEVNAGNFLNYTDDIYIIGDNITNSSAFAGDVAEVISFSVRLSDSDRRDVTSYLALRYGITLDISSEFYTEGGVAIYNNTSSANDIAGIGQNLDNALSQTQSISSNAGAIVKMEGASDLDDGEYIIWGNDGADKTETQTAEISSSFDQRLSAEWQVDVKGDPGTVTVKIYTANINGFNALSQSASSYSLLIDDDSDFSADLISTVSGSSLSNDTLTFSLVTFADNNFFTLAIPVAPSPGDVSTNLSLWLKADADVTESASAISDWTDQSGNDHDAAQGTSDSRPILSSGAVNGNPAVDFDGTDDELPGISGSGFYTQEYFVVFSPDNTASNSSPAEAVLGFDTGSENGLYLGNNFGGLTDEVVTHYVTNGLSYGRAETSPSTTRSGYMLLSSRNNSGASEQEVYIDGTQVDNASDGSILNLSDVNFILGDRASGGLSFDGKIAELISYSSRIASDADRRDLETYLAIKYGITLDISGANPFDAYTSEGVEIYNNSTYTTDIAGIGANGSQELSQGSSMSINSSAILTIGTASSLSDGDYLIWGNDNGSTGTTTSALPAGTTERMTRIWATNETGNIGTVSVTLDLSGLGFGSKVIGDFRLILDSDDNFANGVTNLITAESYTSDVLTFNTVELSGVTHIGLATEVDITLDSDTDGIPDYFETAYGTDPADSDAPVVGGVGGNDADAATGINGDGISDALETILVDNGATAPITVGTDTDGDGIPDYLEVTNGTDPFSGTSPTISGSTDTDGDGIPDALEILITSEGGAADPSLDTDTDGDGVADYYEVINGDDPGDSDSPLVGGGSANDTNDGTGSSLDGISDALETILISGGATAPVEVTTDTDGDGIPDYIEAQTMSDPFNASSPAAVGTPAVRSLQADYEVTGLGCTDISGYQWIDIADNLGNVVFSINPVGNDLGSTCWAVRVVNSSDDAARNDGTSYVLDRNWYIIPTTQPSSSVYLRFYSLDEEHVDLADELLASEVFTYTDDDLRITKISGIDDLNPFVTGGTRVVLNPIVADYSTNGRSLTVGISSFSTFDPYVNPASLETPLPITLIEFNATLNDGYVDVAWATASETDNEFFTVERSVDGVNFEALDNIDGAGDSNERIDYKYVDTNPVLGISYYRLKQTDFDGQFTYSGIERVDNIPSHLSWSYYPNPTTGDLTIKVSEELFDGRVIFTITDLAGHQFSIPFTTRSSTIEADMSSLVPGVYLLGVQINGLKNVSRVIKR